MPILLYQISIQWLQQTSKLSLLSLTQLMLMWNVKNSPVFLSTKSQTFIKKMNLETIGGRWWQADRTTCAWWVISQIILHPCAKLSKQCLKYPESKCMLNRLSRQHPFFCSFLKQLLHVNYSFSSVKWYLLFVCPAFIANLQYIAKHCLY